MPRTQAALSFQTYSGDVLNAKPEFTRKISSKGYSVNVNQNKADTQNMSEIFQFYVIKSSVSSDTN